MGLSEVSVRNLALHVVVCFREQAAGCETLFKIHRPTSTCAKVCHSCPSASHDERCAENEDCTQSLGLQSVCLM